MSQKSAIIYAKTSDDVIGIEGHLPWGVCKEDMYHFKSITENNIVIMGRNTYASINCTPLKGRINIVVSSGLFGNREREVIRYSIENKNKNIGVIKYVSQYGVVAYRNTCLNDVNTELFCVETIEDAQIIAKEYSEKDIFYIGGVEIFKAGYPDIDTIYETTFLMTVDKADRNYKTVSFNVKDFDKHFNDIWEYNAIESFEDNTRNVPTIEIRVYHKLTENKLK